jgi:hypothetical protein
MLKFKILLLFLTLLWLHPAQGSLLQVGSNDFMALPDTTVSTAHPDTLIVGSFEQYLLPVRISGADLVSAISLRLNIPKAFVAADSLLVKSGVTGYLTSITDSVVILAWSSVNPLVLIDGDTLVSLLISTLDLEGLDNPILIEADPATEFADPQAMIIDSVILSIPAMRLPVIDPPDTTSGTTVRVLPNPFKDQAKVEFYLNRESRVRISLFNDAGLLVFAFPDQVCLKGLHNQILHTADLPGNILFLRFEADDGENTTTRVIKLLPLR